MTVDGAFSQLDHWSESKLVGEEELIHHEEHVGKESGGAMVGNNSQESCLIWWTINADSPTERRR